MPALIRLLLLILLPVLHLAASDLDAQISWLCRQQPAGAQIACVVIDCHSGAVIADYQADRAMRLASITKVLVSAAALCELGPDYEMRTSLYRIGKQTGQRIPALGIIARGNPCLDEHFTDRKPNLIFERWAEQLKQQGISEIGGDLIVDASMFSGPAKAPTFPQDHRNQQQWYSAPASAFAWNDNCIEVRAVPGRPGKRCAIEYRPQSPSIKIINKTKSVSKGGNKTFIVSRQASSNTIIVSGSYSRTTSWFPLSIHEDAAQLAADHCKYIFESAGLQVRGRARIDSFQTSPESLLFEDSDKLLPALNILNQRSQNFYGEQIIRILGHHYQGQGNLDFGTAAVKHYIDKHLAISDNSMRLLDGSGLSYDNRASARCIAQVLHKMTRHRHADAFYQSLRTPVYNWAKNEPSRVKTGSLAVARCLAGYIDDGHKHRYAFAILINKGQARSFSWASRLREKLYRLLIQGL